MTINIEYETLWNTDKITGYDFYTDASYIDIASVHVK